MFDHAGPAIKSRCQAGALPLGLVMLQYSSTACIVQDRFKDVQIGSR